ncbi:hypothetical protein [Nostoc sp. CMAA1605]|uniref:hypothetical protein n=1 Tax=Nostoc sp. CMAA1605 TaxID=2055159 RepID=UPI001F3FF8F3|nr:hypothetical protein [Nostoc sp. CMAA1605]MCF4966845.1 hypothetical protein [Nostoc sp. CMAA1605]
MINPLETEESKFDGETFTKVFIYTICAATVLTASILVAKSFIFNGGAVEKSSYPTSIPWINTKLDCENTGRNWIDNKCWDQEHSAEF